MLHNTSGVKIVHKSGGFEVFIHPKDVFDKCTTLNPCVSILIKAVPERDKDNLRFRPDLMNTINKLDIVIIVDCARDIVVSVVVISPQIYDHEIGGRVSLEVPRLWIVAVYLLSSWRGVRSLIPLIHLPAWVSPAVLVL
jgi:hypothetical protein